jgi:hypothetical protein
MGRRMIISMIVALLCFAAPKVYAQRGGRGEGRSAGHAPGGEWSERSHQGGGQRQAGAGTRETAGGRGPGQQGFSANPGGANARSRGPAGAAGGAGQRNPQGTAAASGTNTNRRGVDAAAVDRASGTRNATAGTATAVTGAGTRTAAADNSGAAAVRNSYNNPNLYGNSWYGAHAGAWYPHGWTTAAVWATPTWGAVSGYYGAAAVPLSYNYGVNPAYANGMVTMNGQPVGTPAEFSQQAANLAASGTGDVGTAGDDWMSLGVFAMVRNEQQHPQLILQLAINKQGILRGNYTDEVSDHTQPIQGAADPKTQRAAWTVGDNTGSVMEAGLSDLAQGEAPALIHKNGKTDHWLLVRLDKPAGETADSSPGNR